MMDTATAIKEAVTCREFADFIGLSVNRAGFAVCPFHGDGDASLKIYSGNRGWCCFGCHKGGDVINLASLWYGTPFKETLQRLNDDFHLGIIQESQETGPTRALMAVEIARRKAARLKEERLKAALETDYWRAFDAWLSADRTIRECAPRSPEEEYSDEFVTAIHALPDLRDRLQSLEMERISYDTKQ